MLSQLSYAPTEIEGNKVLERGTLRQCFFVLCESNEQLAQSTLGVSYCVLLVYSRAQIPLGKCDRELRI